MLIKSVWTDKQIAFLNSTKREVLYSGAYGAGKTRSLCLKTLIHAAIPGNLVGLCRKTLSSMKQTTLRTLLYPDGSLPAILPEGRYRHFKQEHLIKIHGGGDIFYFGLDDPLKAGSLNLGACGIDEAVELEEEDYTMLLGRIRNHADPCRQIFGACNPGAPTHFLYKRFFEQQNPKRQVITTGSHDNFFLPSDYLESLDEFTGQNKERYVEGKWVAFEGLVYDMWDASVFVREEEFTPETVVAGIDKGYPSPSSIIIIGVNSDGKVRVLDEFYAAKTLSDDLIRQAKRLSTEYNIDVFMVDPSCADLIELMRRDGLPAHAANNSVQAGINCVGSFLRILADNCPYMTVSPLCINLIKEFAAYRWKDKSIKEQPVKEADHALDALRYGMMYVDQLVNASATVLNLDAKDRKPPPEGALVAADLGWEPDTMEVVGQDIWD